jgi:hypothetical protein
MKGRSSALSNAPTLTLSRYVAPPAITCSRSASQLSTEERERSHANGVLGNGSPGSSVITAATPGCWQSVDAQMRSLPDEITYVCTSLPAGRVHATVPVLSTVSESCGCWPAGYDSASVLAVTTICEGAQSVTSPLVAGASAGAADPLVCGSAVGASAGVPDPGRTMINTMMMITARMLIPTTNRRRQYTSGDSGPTGVRIEVMPTE